MSKLSEIALGTSSGIGLALAIIGVVALWCSDQRKPVGDEDKETWDATAFFLAGIFTVSESSLPGKRPSRQRPRRAILPGPGDTGARRASTSQYEAKADLVRKPTLRAWLAGFLEYAPAVACPEQRAQSEKTHLFRIDAATRSVREYCGRAIHLHRDLRLAVWGRC